MAASIPGQERTPKRFFRRLLPFYSSFLVLGGVGGQKQNDFARLLRKIRNRWADLVHFFFGGGNHLARNSHCWRQMATTGVPSNRRRSPTFFNNARPGNSRGGERLCTQIAERNANGMYLGWLTNERYLPDVLSLGSRATCVRLTGELLQKRAEELQKAGAKRSGQLPDRMRPPELGATLAGYAV